MATILVTGSSGLVGRPLAAALRRADGHNVHGLDIVADPAATPAELKQHIDDLSSLDRLERLLRSERVDAVVHGGGVSGPMVAADDPYAVTRANVVGSLNLIEAARRAGVRRFVYLSSASAYGHTEGDPVPDDPPLRPLNVYGATKGAVDLVLAAHIRQFGFPGVSLRLSHVYGPGRRTECVIATMLAESLAGRPVELAWGRGYARPFLFVDDAVTAIRATLAAPDFSQPFYNIAGPDHVEIAQLAELVARQVPGARIALGEGPPPGGDRRGRLDLRAATRDFGYRPSVDIAAGVARYAAWMRAGSPPYFGSRV